VFPLLPIVLALAPSAPDQPAHVDSTAQPGAIAWIPSSSSVQDPAAAPAAPKWTGNVSLGGTIAAGNTESRTATFNFDAERRAEKDRWTAKAWWNYTDQEDSEGDSEVTQRRLGASLQYDYFLTKRAYWLARVGTEYDFKAGLDLRTQAGVGAGYQFYEEEEFKLAGEAGLTYFWEDYASGDDNDYLAARLASNLGWLIRKGVQFDQTLEIFPSLEDKDDVYGKADNRLKVTLTEAMFAQAQYVFTYDNTPDEDKERDDHLFVLTLGWAF